jgi:hypothetical protein
MKRSECPGKRMKRFNLLNNFEEKLRKDCGSRMSIHCDLYIHHDIGLLPEW